jgi:hypothetical protein
MPADANYGGGGTRGAAMIRVGNFPENSVGIARVDETRVILRNISVNLAMDMDMDRD